MDTTLVLAQVIATVAQAVSQFPAGTNPDIIAPVVGGLIRVSLLQHPSYQLLGKDSLNEIYNDAYETCIECLYEGMWS